MPSYSVKSKKSILLLIMLGLITLSGTFLRLHNLGQLNFNADELDHVFAAKNLLAHNGPILPSGMRYDRALSYSYLVALSFKIFGESEFAARLPSVLFSILMIPLVYLISRYFLETQVISLCASALLAFDPWSILISRFCRMYTLLAFLFLLLLIVFYQSIALTAANSTVTYDEGKKKAPFVIKGFRWHYLGFTILLFLFAYRIHPLAISFLFVSGFFLLFLGTKRYFKSETRRLITDRIYLLIPVLFLSFCLLFLVIFEKDFFFHVKSSLGFSEVADWFRLGGPLFYLTNLEKYLYWHAWSFGLIGAICMFFSGREKRVFVASSFLIPFLLLSLFPKKGFRFMYHLHPVFLIVMCYSVVSLFKWLISVTRNRMYRQEAITIVALVVIFSLLWFSKDMTNGWRNSYGLAFSGRDLPVVGWPAKSYEGKSWEEISDYLKKNASQDDWIAAGSGIEIAYYYGKVDFQLPASLKVGAMRFKDNNQIRNWYTGAIVLEKMEDFEKIMNKNRSLWVIVDSYDLKNIYPNDHLQEVLDHNFNLRFKTRNKSFRIYFRDQMEYSRSR